MNMNKHISNKSNNVTHLGKRRRDMTDSTEYETKECRIQRDRKKDSSNEPKNGNGTTNDSTHLTTSSWLLQTVGNGLKSIVPFSHPTNTVFYSNQRSV